MRGKHWFKKGDHVVVKPLLDEAVVLAVTRRGVHVRLTQGFMAGDDSIYDYNDVEPIVPLKLEEVLDSSKDPLPGAGYLVTADGTIHALRRQATHGLCLAVLFPEWCEKHGYVVPHEKSRAHDYQSLELDHARELPVVRIAFGFIMYSTNLSKGDAPCTPEQVDAVRRQLMQRGMNLNDTLQTELLDCTLRKALKWLEKDTTDEF